MIKESCHLIGQNHISVYNSKLCVFNCGKTLLFHSKSINLSFWIIFNLDIPSKLTKDINGKSRQVWVWLRLTGHTQLKVKSLSGYLSYLSVLNITMQNI